LLVQDHEQKNVALLLNFIHVRNTLWLKRWFVH